MNTCEACKKPETECLCVTWEHECGQPRTTPPRIRRGPIDGDRLVIGRFNDLDPLGQMRDARVERDNGRFL